MIEKIDDEQKRCGTETSSFGTNGHINHDSSKFYKSNLYKGIIGEDDVEYFENQINPENINRIFCKSSENMEELPSNSVHLMVTSPPYNVGKDYDDDLTLRDYLEILNKIFRETYRVLVQGGRACINVANLGRKPYIPLHSYIINSMHEIGFLMRGEILWDKGSSASPSTAWGSYLKASNPVLRDVHEYILIFCKGTFSRKNPENRNSTISKLEFLENTKSIWKFSAERAKKIGHPAPFPLDLPYRLIQLYTFEGEIVLDPFVGSGTTCIAAMQTKRKYIGYDIEPSYCKISEKRINEFMQTQEKLFL